MRRQHPPIRFILGEPGELLKFPANIRELITPDPDEIEKLAKTKSFREVLDEGLLDCKKSK